MWWALGLWCPRLGKAAYYIYIETKLKSAPTSAHVPPERLLVDDVTRFCLFHDETLVCDFAFVLDLDLSPSLSLFGLLWF